MIDGIGVQDQCRLRVGDGLRSLKVPETVFIDLSVAAHNGV